MVLAPLCAKPRRLIDAIPEYLRDLPNWPGYNSDAIKDGKHRDRFDALVKVANLYLLQQPITAALKAVPIGERGFMKLMRRALERSTERPGIVGLQAFVKFKHVKARTRTAPLRSFQDSPSAGFTGEWQHLLTRHEEIEPALIAYCLDKNRPTILTPHNLHVEFKRILAELVQKDLMSTLEYPFGTASMCEAPLNKWFKDVFLVKHGDKDLARRYGKLAAVAAKYGDGNGEAAVPQPNHLEWVIDEADGDVHAKYEIASGLGDWEEIELPRFKVIRCRTFTFGVNVHARLVLRKEVSANDIVILLYEAVSGVPPVAETVPDLKPLPGAGWPVNMFAQLKYRTPIRVYLDNALVHLADVVHYVVVTLWGGELVLGAPRNPKERALIESSIRTHAMRVTHQVPGSAGSGPHDPVRQISEVPVKQRCDARDLAHVLAVYFQNENVLPNAASHHLSPFTRMERMLSRDLIQTGEVPVDKRRPHMYSEPVIRGIKVDPANGRRPYVNFFYATYSSDYLRDHPQVAGQDITLRPDPDDLRQVLAFRLDGTEIGLLDATGHWGDFPNDFAIRKIYGQHRKKGRLGPRADDEPMYRLYRFLKNGAKKDKRLAMQLAYLINHFERHMTREEFEALDRTQPANDPVAQPSKTATGTDGPIQGSPARPADEGITRAPQSATVHRINVPRIARR